MIMHAVTGSRADRRVVLVGGDHPRSPHTRVLVEEAARALAAAGARPLDWDADHGLDGDLGTAIGTARAMILVTPLVHNSYSGRLKTVLDVLEPRQLNGMPVGLMATRGHGQDAQALDHLRTVVRSLDGRAVPGQIVATPDEFGAGEPGTRQPACWQGGSALRGRIADFSRELLWFMERFRPEDPDTGVPPVSAGHAGRLPAPAPVSPAPVATASVTTGPVTTGPVTTTAPVVSAVPAARAAAPGIAGTAVLPPLPEALAIEPQPGSPGAPLADTASRGIALAIAHIRGNFTDPDLSLNEVAKAACMSRYHFSRTFKAQTGVRYIDFLTRLRLARARTLLMETEDPVSAICHAAGFSDLSHFERTFKRWFEVSPSRYRAGRGAALDR